MSFRQNFENSYSLQVTGPYRMTRAERSLEHTIDLGFTATSQNLEVLTRELAGTFENGIKQLSASNSDLAQVLRDELRYQTDLITEAVYEGSAEIVTALASMCDYLGRELCQIRWAIERQTRVSEQILRVLLGSLDNTSRQYWEQGVKCYEATEYELARERFNRALDSNRTNSFAYQYLGFIAVNEDDSNTAIKNFELAKKFADTGYHRAFALSHLARCYCALGDLAGAVRSAHAATEACPENAKFWYECAVYRVKEQNTQEALRCLRVAIAHDITYWSISATDHNLNPIRNGALRLLEEMRDEARTKALETIDDLRRTLAALQRMAIGEVLAEKADVLNRAEAQIAKGTVFAYRDLLAPIQEAHRAALNTAIENLQRLAGQNREAVSALASREAQEIAKAEAKAAAAAKTHAETRNPAWDIGCTSPIAIFWLFVASMAWPSSLAVGCVFWLIVLGIYWAARIAKFAGAKGSASETRQAFLETQRSSRIAVATGVAELDAQLDVLKRNQAMCEDKLKALVNTVKGTWP